MNDDHARAAIILPSSREAKPTQQIHPPGMSSPPREGGVGQRRHGLGSQGVGLVPMVSEQERVWKVSQFSVLVSC